MSSITEERKPQHHRRGTCHMAGCTDECAEGIDWPLIWCDKHACTEYACRRPSERPGGRCAWHGDPKSKTWGCV
jgi:hypothetical protein